ncbi:hypothetical protein [Streptomyces cyaneofuscatus]|uniref:hypothetical protein n=1 Tax=Streptomyces cyaneofuscatus TaxID=66883 RepID=UPI0036C6ADD5
MSLAVAGLVPLAEAPVAVASPPLASPAAASPAAASPAVASPAVASSTAVPSSPAARPAAVAAASPAGVPVVADRADGTAMIFARGADDTLYRRAHNQKDDTWNAWTSTGGKAVGDPVTARDLNKRLSVFVRRADGRLWLQKQAAAGGWSAWTSLGAPQDTTVAGAPVVVANDNTYSNRLPNDNGVVQGNTDGRLEVFVRGGDNRIWHRVQTGPNSAKWSDWEALPGMWAGSPAAAVGGDGRITVVARKADGILKVTAQKRRSTSSNLLPADNWTPWLEIGTDYTGNPALAVNTPKAGTLFQVFGTKNDGRVWSVGQSGPGTTQKPAGVWATGDVRIGPSAPGRPVVVTHPDGRLAVFGINAEDRVVYKTQTSSATKANPVGIWNAEPRVLDGRKARSVTAYSVPGGSSAAFSVFVLGKDSDTLYQRSRLSLGDAYGSRPDVWLDWTDLADIGAGPCAGPGSLDCLAIWSSGLNMALSPEGAGPDRYLTRSTGGIPMNWLEWSLRRTNDRLGAFQIVHPLQNQCIEREGVDNLIEHLTLAPCKPESLYQLWYLDPVLPTGADKSKQSPSEFRLRSAFPDKRCLTALAEDVWPHSADRVEMIVCDTDSDNDHNTWKLGRNSATAPGVLGIALDQSVRRCAADSTSTVDTCKFVPTQEPSAYRAVNGCVVGKVLYNQSANPSPYSVAWTRTTGTELTFGRTVGISVEFLTAEFSASVSWLQQDSVAETATVNVPPNQFGWVEIAPVMRETIGYWQITLSHNTWTVPGHNVSYAKDGTNGVDTYVVARTSESPPHAGHCAS